MNKIAYFLCLLLASACQSNKNKGIAIVPKASYSDLEKLAKGSKEAQERQKKAVASGFPLELALEKSAIRFRLIPAGSFTMGSPRGEFDRSNQYEKQEVIKIATPFYIGKFEITQGQWQQVMGENPAGPVKT